MKEHKLTIKDSALSFLLGFLLCQLGVIVATCITFIIFKISGSNMDLFESFFNSAIGYLISALALYLVMLLIFFYFNKAKENQIGKRPQIKKLLLYITIAIISFFSLYPIIVCVDSLLIKCGIKISSIPYDLTTKNYFISLLSLVIAPAICEELLFRGIIFKGLKKHGQAFAIILTSVMFTLFHMSISQTVYPLLMGLLLSVIMFYENNIYYCIAVHLTNNFLSLTLSYFKVNLIFQHWTYILLAIFLFIAFTSVTIYLTFRKNKTHEKEKVSKEEKSYLLVVLITMIILWFSINFL